MTRHLDEASRQATARQLLKKAYVSMNFGYFQKALTACDRAVERADDPLVAETMRGAILTASGRPVEAMRELIGLHRRHPEAILTALYLAEACFLAGRHRRAWKTLEGIDQEALADSPWCDFGRELRRTWRQLDDIDDLAEPVEVALETASDRPVDEP